MEAQKLAAQE